MNKVIMLALICAQFMFGINHSKGQCTANFSFSISSGNVSFTSTSVGTTSNTNYTWHFGNGSSLVMSNNTQPSIVYTNNQIYTVQLQLNDSSAACNASITKTLAISGQPCNSSIAFTSTQLGNGVRSFQASSNYWGYTYTWNFGDGGSSNINSPSHTYSVNGSYLVSLTAVSLSSTCTYTTSQTISVSVVPCSLTASYTYSYGANGTVNFVSTSTGTSPSTTFAWNFNDGGTNSATQVNHQYLYNGTYAVHLALSETSGFNNCSSSVNHTVTVTNASCFATSIFTMHKDSSQVLHWMVWPSYPQNISAALWMWGDGSSSTGLYPSHTYSAAGAYNICLSVTVSCGSTFSICSLSTIYKANGNEQIISVDVVNPASVGLASINRDNTSTITIIPNPNDANFSLRLNSDSKNNPVDLKIVNLLGEVVYSESYVETGANTGKKIDAGLSSGTYFVKVTVGGKTSVSKMLVYH